MTFKTSVPAEATGSLVRALETPEAPVVKPLKEMKASHERAARLVAMGAKDRQIAEAVGLSPTTMKTLRADPHFQIVVADWKGIAEKGLSTDLGELRAVFHDGIQLLQQYIEERAVSPATLVDILKTIAPKIGIQDAPQLVEHKINNDTLNALKAKAQDADAVRVVKAEATIIPEEQDATT